MPFWGGDVLGSTLLVLSSYGIAAAALTFLIGLAGTVITVVSDALLTALGGSIAGSVIEYIMESVAESLYRFIPQSVSTDDEAVFRTQFDDFITETAKDKITFCVKEMIMLPVQPVTMILLAPRATIP